MLAQRQRDSRGNALQAEVIVGAGHFAFVVKRSRQLAPGAAIGAAFMAKAQIL